MLVAHICQARQQAFFQHRKIGISSQIDRFDRTHPLATHKLRQAHARILEPLKSTIEGLNGCICVLLLQFLQC